MIFGVSYYKRDNKFQAHCSNGSGKLIHLGLFDNVEEAFEAYKAFKKQIITNAVLIYFGRGEIDKETFRALCKYEVSIYD